MDLLENATQGTESNCEQGKVLNLLKASGHILTEYTLHEKKVVERNSHEYQKLMKYKTSYTEEGRFLFGSWLLTSDKVPRIFDKKAVIIIKTLNSFVDVVLYDDIFISLTQKICDIFTSLFFQLYKVDAMISFGNKKIYRLENGYTIPHYSMILSKEEERSKRNLENALRTLSNDNEKKCDSTCSLSVSTMKHF
nr:22 kDa protein [Ophiovirus lactucae]